MTTGFAAIEDKKNQLIRKGLTGSVFIADATATAVTKATLFDDVTGDLVSPLPDGYWDLGYTTTDGAKISHSIKQSELDAWGSNYPVRTDITSIVPTLVVEAMETKLGTVGLSTGQDTSSIEAGANGAWSIQPSINPTTRFYRVLLLAVDKSELGEFVVARYLPNASITDLGDQTFANGDAAITWPLTFTAYPDNSLGYAEDYLVGGAAALALASDMSVPRDVVLTTVSASPDVVATTGVFFASDEGKAITGAGIPSDTTILTFTDSTHVILSHNATASATLVAAVVS